MAKRFPKYDIRGLLKELHRQGFEVKETKMGFVVERNGQRTVFHASQLKKNGHVGTALYSHLRKIGFIHPDDWKKCEREKKVRRLREDGHGHKDRAAIASRAAR